MDFAMWESNLGTCWHRMATDCGGEGWIRTSVRLRGQIYSLLPLTTRPPLQVLGRGAMWRCRFGVSTRVEGKSFRPRRLDRPAFAKALAGSLRSINGVACQPKLRRSEGWSG